MEQHLKDKEFEVEHHLKDKERRGHHLKDKEFKEQKRRAAVASGVSPNPCLYHCRLSHSLANFPSHMDPGSTLLSSHTTVLLLLCAHTKILHLQLAQMF